MTPESVNTIAAFSSLIISVIAIATAVYSSATRMAKVETMVETNHNRLSACEAGLDGVKITLTELRVKADTLWAFQMRRGVAEAVNSELAKMESPVVFRKEAMDTLAPLKARLVAFVDENEHLKPLDLALKMEAEFGPELLVDFCIPERASNGACLLAAMQAGTGKLVEVTNDDNVLAFVTPKKTVKGKA